MKQIDAMTIVELSKIAQKMYDAREQFLLENGSVQNDLWGMNLYPDKFGTSEFIEFDSMINIHPR